MTDLERISEDLGKILKTLLGQAHSPLQTGRENSDSLTITKDGILDVAIKLQRLQDYVDGLVKYTIWLKDMKGEAPAEQTVDTGKGKV